jgi:hypothetical protein
MADQFVLAEKIIDCRLQTNRSAANQMLWYRSSMTGPNIYSKGIFNGAKFLG